jgi:hypothetical protein
MNSTKPLEWPVNWAALTPSQKLLMDFHFVGTLDRSFKGIAEQLKHRSEVSRDSWKPFCTKEQTIARVIARIAKEEIGWPNTYFIPDDPFEILLWDAGEDLLTTSALERIESDIGLEGMDDDQWKELASQTFGEVVCELSARNVRRQLNEL